MTIERLNSRDKRLLLIVLILSIASVVYTRLSYEAAFPQASIDLRYSREEITRMAAEFLDQRGLDPAGFRNITIFDPDHLARIYLERELGLEEANRLAADEVSIWRWRARWFRPPEREERVAWLSPTGRVVGLDHVIPEAEAGARLASDEALAIAEAFLAQRTAESHRLIEQTLIERPNRYDYVFTWEREVFRAGDAPYRRTVTVQGNAVGRYREFLHVPEEWRREYAALRSRNDLYAGIAQFFYVPLILGAIAILIQSLRRRQLIWKPLIAIAAAVGGLMILNEWNAIAFFIDRMPTSSPYHESVLFGLLQAMGAGVGVFFYVILAAAAGEPLYRAQHPGKLSLRGILTLRGVCSKEFFLATLVGYGLAAVHMAFVVAFYLAGRRFGAWSPQDVPYSDLLSTWLPWLYPLTISLLASTSEEFWFRLFGIPFLKRYLKYTWLAVAVSAFVWGFLHANYPQQPPWIRGVEVGIIGLAAGYLFLKFGILATLIWHYTIDAVLIGMFLFQAEDWYFRLSGVVVAGAVLFPLLFSLVQYRRNGGFIHDPEILNASVHREEEEAAPAVAPEQPASAAADVRRWSVRWLYGAAAIGLASGVFLNPVTFGAFIEVRLTPRQAAQAADLSLLERGVDPAAWRSVTDFIPNLAAAEFEYVRRIEGWQEANRVVAQWTQTGLWRTRYFRPEEAEEWNVYVNQAGRVERVAHRLPETAPGARLPVDQARSLAETYLTDTIGLNLDAYRLVDAQTEERPNRTDHLFVWERLHVLIGEAVPRISLVVQGDEVSGFRRFLKLPEEWLREFERPRLRTFLLPGVIGVLLLPLLLIFIKRISGRGAYPHLYHWRAYFTFGAVAAVLATAAMINQWPTLLAGYPTAMPLANYYGQLLIGRIILILVTGAGVFLAAFALDVFYQLAAGHRPLAAPSMPRAIAILLLLWGVGNILAVVGQAMPGPRFSLPLWTILGIDTYVPAIAVLNQGYVFAVTRIAAAGIAVFAFLRFVAPNRRLWLLAFLAGAVALSRGNTVLQGGYYFAAALLLAGVLLLLVKTCGVADLLTFGLALLWLAVLDSGSELILQPAPLFTANGAAAVLIALLAGVWIVWRYRDRRIGG